MIKISNIFKNFGPKEVLKGIDLEIENEKITCIIGKSGCGKSVLLKNIVGLLEPDSGEVTIDGENILNKSKEELYKIRKNIGYVFQSAALYDSYNVFENIILGQYENGRTDLEELEQEAQKVLSAVGLIPQKYKVSNEVFQKEWEILKFKKPSDLSGGMRKRVGVARALMGSPKYIFYDEPTTGLDPVTSEQIDDLIKELSDNFKITSIVITHDMFTVYRIADKVAMMDDGRVIFVGNVDELKSNENQEIQAFIERFN